MKRQHVAVFGGLLGCWGLLLAWGGPASDSAPGRSEVGGAAHGGTADATAVSAPGAPDGAPPVVEYTLSARLDHKRHIVRGTLDLLWRNPSDRPADRLPFHLYLNAFAHQGTRFLEAAWRHGVTEVLDAGGWGSITVRDVQVDGVAARKVSEEDDGTVLGVFPARPVPGRGSARVTLGFEARLPKMRARTGYAGSYHVVAQWFPKIGRRETDGTWHCQPFHLTSEFFADFGTYDVTLEVPKGFEVAATGALQPGGKPMAKGRRLRYLARRVHDFVWVAAPGLQRARGRVGKVALEVVHSGADAQAVARHLAHARGALERLERWLAPYPYPVLTAVLVPREARAAAGMEYPTLFTSTADHPPFLERLGTLSTTVHELIHQYFYGLLASNEVEEPWLDEGFTSYVTGLVMDDLHGADRSAAELGPFRVGSFALNRIWYRTWPGMDAPRRRSMEFAAPRSYFLNVYGKTSLALRTLEKQIGRSRMLALLSDYVRQNRFRHPRGEDFFRVLDAHVPEKALRRFFREAVGTDGVLDYAVESAQVRSVQRLEGEFDHADAKARKEARAALVKQGIRHWNRVLLVRRGALKIPVTVALRFADGSREERTWSGEERWHWIEVPHRSALVSAEIDPGGGLALEATLLDNGRRVTPDARPARRVAGRLLLGLQIALQGVGF